MEKEVVVQPGIHPLLKSYLPIAEGIAKTFGDFCEVVLHDLTDVSSSIVAVFNGKVTGRGLGSPVTNLGLEIIRRGEAGEDLWVNYPNTSINGKKIKSSSMIIRDHHQDIIGCLCINLDLTYLELSKSIIDGIMTTATSAQARHESFSHTINELEDRIIRDGITLIGKPVSLMTKEEREEFVYYLEQKGLFLIKGAIQKVAKMMNISKFTLYNYLDKANSEARR